MKTWISLLSIAFVFVLFQNCGVPTFSASGNGNGYGGMRDDNGALPGGPTAQLPMMGSYINHLENTVCDDGTDVRARLLVTTDHIYLVREDCQDLVPSVVVSTNSVAAGPSSLTYDNRVFHYTP